MDEFVEWYRLKHPPKSSLAWTSSLPVVPRERIIDFIAQMMKSRSCLTKKHPSYGLSWHSFIALEMPFWCKCNCANAIGPCHNSVDCLRIFDWFDFKWLFYAGKKQVKIIILILWDKWVWQWPWQYYCFDILAMLQYCFIKNVRTAGCQITN